MEDPPGFVKVLFCMKLDIHTNVVDIKLDLNLEQLPGDLISAETLFRYHPNLYKNKKNGRI